MIVKFSNSKQEITSINRIAKRFCDMMKEHGNEIDFQSLCMDLEACHCNGCKLDLQKLEGFDDFNLAHDCAGIMNHIDRKTGKLSNHFLPRSAR